MENIQPLRIKRCTTIAIIHRSFLTNQNFLYIYSAYDSYSEKSEIFQSRNRSLTVVIHAEDKYAFMKKVDKTKRLNE